MNAFPIICNGQLNFRRWYLISFGIFSVVLLAILLKFLTRPDAFLLIGIFILCYTIIYIFLREYRKRFQIFADRIDIMEDGRIIKSFKKNSLVAVKFRLLHPSLFMTEKVKRYYTQHFLQIIDDQDNYEYEVQESDVQPIIKNLKSMSYRLTDLAESMNYFKEDPFYKYSLKIILFVILIFALIIFGVYMYF